MLCIFRETPSIGVSTVGRHVATEQRLEEL